MFQRYFEWHEGVCFAKAANSRMFTKKWLSSVLPCEENLLQNFHFQHSPSMLWQKKVCLLTSIPVFAYGKKTVLKIWKHKLIPKRRESSGGVNLDAAPLMSCLKLLIHMEFSPSDIRGVWVAKHSSATQIPPIYSSNHPKNLCYVVIIKNNYGPTLSSSWLKSLGTARGKVSPQTNGGGYPVKAKANGSISEPKYQSLS